MSVLRAPATVQASAENGPPPLECQVSATDVGPCNHARGRQLYLRVAALRKVRPGSGRYSRCSFCGQESDEVGGLIEGPNVSICADCIAACNDLLDDDAVDSEPTSESDQGQPLDHEAAERPVFFRVISEADVQRLLTMD